MSAVSHPSETTRRPVSDGELLAFGAELLAVGVYARVLHILGPREHPDDTWKLVMFGVVLSSLPAIALARLEPPPSWRRYEARVAVGFILSAAVIVPWQLYLTAERAGWLSAYATRSLSYDQPEPLE